MQLLWKKRWLKEDSCQASPGSAQVPSAALMVAASPKAVWPCCFSLGGEKGAVGSLVTPLIISLYHNPDLLCTSGAANTALI